MPDTVLLLDNVPHDWLLPQCCAVVHHGGAGTTAAGISLCCAVLGWAGLGWAVLCCAAGLTFVLWSCCVVPDRVHAVLVAVLACIVLGSAMTCCANVCCGMLSYYNLLISASGYCSP